ncbi:MAG TPA: GDSL-type esterase/lipase family protein [Ktedonobacteraceae bacterium]
MKRSDNDTRPDHHRHETGGTAAGTVFGWVFRLLRGSLRRGGRQGGRAVVTGVTTGVVKAVVACLGASATDATGSYDWIRDLAQRPNNASLRFYRFAEGGDLAYNGLARLPSVINCHPDYVIVLLGENDVLALISTKVAQFDRLTKHLPGQPSPQWYRENMQAIVHRLKSETQAAIALCSLIPIGEDPGSVNPFQAEANRRIEEYSAILKDIAREEEVSYLPLYERLHELILAFPGRAFTSFDFLPFYRDVFRQFVLHKSHDEIGQLNGWRFHRDGIHLNSRSGKLLADLVQEFLSAGAGVESPR